MLAWSARGSGFKFQPGPVLFYLFQFGVSVLLLQAAKGLSRRSGKVLVILRIDDFSHLS